MLFETLLATIMAAMTPPTATIVFAGDAMQHQKQLDAARTADGTYDYSQCFEDIAPWVSEADYAVVNLETPLGFGNFSGYPVFNAPAEFAAALRDAGFDLLLTANNHTLDRRETGLKTTVAILDTLGIDHIGTYASADDRRQALPFIRDINGFKVGFLNYTYGTNGFPMRGGVIVDMIDRRQIVDDITLARESGAEIVVVAVHWGVEYVLLPPASVKSLADFLCSQDVDMVIGGHPHVIQPMEMRPNPTTGRPVLLVYSMGNLISNMRTRDTRGGAMVKAVLQRDSAGTAYVDNASYMPHFTVPGTSPAKNYRVWLLPDDNRVDSVIAPDFRPHAKAWLKAAIPVFDRHNRDVPRASR